MPCAGRGPPPPTAAHRRALPPTDRRRAHRRAPPLRATVVAPVFVAVAFVRPARGRQAMDDEVSENELELAAVLGARFCFGARRARLAIRAGHVRKLMGGSRRGRRPSRQRDSDLGAFAILRDYFGVNGRPPVYGEDEFEDRFRMPRPVFNRLFRAIYDQPFWRRTVSATGRPEAHAIQKVAAPLRVLGYGESFDRADEYCCLSRSSMDDATRRLTEFVIDKWESTYLRRQTDVELEHILTRKAARGMPGCMGSIDCTHWQWHKCPNALCGQYLDSKGKRSVVIETVCDEDLYIWHLFVDCHGAYHDMSVLASSPLMLDENAGAWPPRTYKYTLNVHFCRLRVYAPDAGYPRYPLFALPHPKPDRPTLLVYNFLQEAVRKNAERLYAVWWSRWFIMKYPARCMSVLRLIKAAKATSILHNLAVEHKRQGFIDSVRVSAAAADRGPRIGDGKSAAFTKDAGPRKDCVWGAAVAAAITDEPEAADDGRGPIVGSARYMYMAEAEAKNTDRHLSLLNDLSEHVWADRGRLLAPHVRLLLTGAHE